jgi:hypothetical protein
VAHVQCSQQPFGQAEVGIERMARVQFLTNKDETLGSVKDKNDIPAWWFNDGRRTSSKLCMHALWEWERCLSNQEPTTLNENFSPTTPWLNLTENDPLNNESNARVPLEVIFVTELFLKGPICAMPGLLITPSGVIAATRGCRVIARVGLTTARAGRDAKSVLQRGTAGSKFVHLGRPVEKNSRSR